jgi:hypothetical protein
MNIKKISAILGLIVLLIGLVKVGIAIDGRYAKAQDYKIDKLRNELRWLRYQKEEIERRYDCLYNTPKCFQVMPTEAKKAYRQYIDDESFLLDLLKQIEGD